MSKKREKSDPQAMKIATLEYKLGWAIFDINQLEARLAELTARVNELEQDPTPVSPVTPDSSDDSDYPDCFLFAPMSTSLETLVLVATASDDQLRAFAAAIITHHQPEGDWPSPCTGCLADNRNDERGEDLHYTMDDWPCGPIRTAYQMLGLGTPKPLPMETK